MIYSDIENLSNAEAVAQFKDLTNDPMPCGEIEFFLSQNGLAKRNAITGSWEGVLIDAISTLPSIALLFEHLNGPRNISVDTTEFEWASLCSTLVTALVSGSVITQATADDFMNLGGGYLYPSLDEAYVQAIRDEEAAKVASREAMEQETAARNAHSAKWDALYNQHLSPLYDAADYSDAAWIAALNAMAANWSN